ncbi:nucleoside/nucleotide kinase family protein [Streptomyces flavalbus]|uniref:Nucleoside/nucleotide kinase family protein n=1 Tax=Streptomyces flavalbus TaxID=2665155 RepID=A0ABW2WHH0_9ACTN
MHDDDRTAPLTFDALLARARALTGAGRRRAVLGIAGGPGAGKSTLAERLVRELNGGGEPWAARVPMDGFHLADVELRRLGRLDRKGAPDTFDAGGYAALLRRLREESGESGETVYAPEFERDLEQPLAGAIPVGPSVRLVVTEGNYLLLDADPWRRVRAALDEVWFCELPEAERVRRLVARHEEFGKAHEAAVAWALGSDQRNADLIAPTRARADLVVPVERVGGDRPRASRTPGGRTAPDRVAGGRPITG